MMWLEMSRDSAHGGGSWAFTYSLWAPTRTQGGARWPFWESVSQVKAGDVIVHLRDNPSDVIERGAYFVGSSVAETDGFETSERPIDPGQWSFAGAFYRVRLTGYEPFPYAVPLREVFSQKRDRLYEYFARNKASVPKKRLFYVLQAGRLQRLNGGYLSELDDELMGILFGSDIPERGSSSGVLVTGVQTGQRAQEVLSRVGQREFSEKVRANYGSRCCFPSCSITERAFLVGAHIARWTDSPVLRGELSNGLCLCLMHDRAFEFGFFTITGDFRIAVNEKRASSSRWCQDSLLAFNGQLIRRGAIDPSEQALREHWERVGFTP